MPDFHSTGVSALQAFQRMLATTSHNVANATTPGYTRQRVLLSTRGGQDMGRGYIGGGVMIAGIERVSDAYVTARLQDSASELGRLTQMAGLATRIDQLFSDTASGIAQPLSDFLDAAQSLSAQPTSAAARSDFLGKAESLVARFRSMNAQLNNMVTESRRRAEDMVDSVNTDVAEVARLNAEIVRQYALGSNAPPNDLLDQRDIVVQRLAQRMGVTTTIQDDGAMNVFSSAGQGLVVGTATTRLTMLQDRFDPARSDLSLATATGPVRLVGSAVGGELGGLLSFANDVLDPAQERLGRLATAVAVSVNAQHREGLDLYGAMGGDLFTAPTPTVLQRNLNSGTATLSGRVSNLGTLDGSAFEMVYDGASWRAIQQRTGAVLPMTGTGTLADPFLVGGLSLTLGGGAPASGDSFLVRPTAQAPDGLQVAITDPSRLAVANPVRSAAAVGNIGSARIGTPEVLDPINASLRNPVTIQFVSSTQYTLNGSGPFSFSPGTPIVANGWSVSIDNAPIVAGDTFTITPMPAQSSDNGNGRLLAGLGHLGLLEGGNVSMNAETAGIASQVGSSARTAQLGRDAQAAIDYAVRADKEAASGVNLDEEAANMLRFQQAYQAAAQIVASSNDTFQSLLDAVRR